MGNLVEAGYLSSQSLPRSPLAAIPGYLLRRSQRVHNTLWKQHVPGGLTSPQYAVLTALAHNPHADQATVGTLASLDKSSGAEVVARLVSGQWIERTRDPTDGRRYTLSLSPSASLTLARLTPAAAAVQSELLKPVEPDKRSLLVSGLRQLARLTHDGSDMRTRRTMPDVLDFDAPGHLIRRAQQVHTSIWTDVLLGEFTGPQFATMHVLAVHGGLSHSALGRIAALDKSTLTHLLIRLAERGWVNQVVDSSDARSRRVTLTPAGVQKVEASSGQVSLVQQTLLAPLPDPQKDLVVSQLSRLAFEGEPPEWAFSTG